MEIYDSHAHFSTSSEQDIAVLLSRAQAAGVSRILAVGGSAELNDAALLAAKIGGASVRTALGLDRDQAVSMGEEARAAFARDMLTCPPAAIGEIGLDFHYEPESARDQCTLFAEQLALADNLNRPVVIHTREADDATLGVLDEIPWHGSGLRGVIHCYTGAPAFAGKCLDRGFMVSFSGIVTFKSAETVRDSARYVPFDRLLVETDTPYLAPVPLRGKPNEPAFIIHTVQFLAALRGVSTEQLAALTVTNALGLFGND